LYCCLDDQNKYLIQLVELKVVEVYSNQKDLEDLEADAKMKERGVEVLNGPDIPISPKM